MLGEKLAISIKSASQRGAIVLGLQGDLGAGKTTFLQGFAKGLGIKEKILSPTFVIYKKFKINIVPKNERSFIFWHKYFYHFDCYRINKPEEILELGFREIVSNPKNIVAIEWSKRIKKLLPKNLILIKFRFIDKNPDGEAIEDPRRNRDKREILFCIKTSHKV